MSRISRFAALQLLVRRTGNARGSGVLDSNNLNARVGATGIARRPGAGNGLGTVARGGIGVGHFRAVGAAATGGRGGAGAARIGGLPTLDGDVRGTGNRGRRRGPDRLDTQPFIFEHVHLLAWTHGEIPLISPGHVARAGAGDIVEVVSGRVVKIGDGVRVVICLGAAGWGINNGF